MAVAPNPLVYTTTGAKTTLMVAVDSFRWVSSAASGGDACIVKDSGGNVIFESEAPGAEFIDVMRRPPTPFVNGITVDTIGSGNLYVYYK